MTKSGMGHRDEVGSRRPLRTAILEANFCRLAAEIGVHRVQFRHSSADHEAFGSVGAMIFRL